ncbi:MAG: hypothetical protein DCC55_15235 [Chloroflexi bacterium]|nr:MAG: hypothetical protein DCC55_15235 [Chloroflexota bacterium]
MINLVRSRVKPDRVEQILAAVTVALVMLGFAALLVTLIRTALTSVIPFDMDEANHATDGWEVYHAFTSRSPRDLYRSVVEQSFYPPVHSFFVAAGYALGGPTLASSRLPTVVNLVFVLALLVWLTTELARKGANRQPGSTLMIISASIVLAFALTSKIFITNAVLAMVEMTGALLGLALALVSARVEQQPGGNLHWRAVAGAAVMAVLAFLTKYSFGLFFLPALLAGLVTRTWPWRAGRRTWVAVVVAAALYFVLLSSWWVATDGREMLLFFTDHPQYAPLWSRTNLFYQARVWYNGYSASWAVASLTLLLAGVGAVCQWRLLAVRVAAWSVLAGVVVLTLSPTDEARHFLPLAPLVWLLAGLGLAEVLHWLRAQAWGEPVRVASVVVMLVLLGWGAQQMVAALPTRLITSLEGVPAHTQLYTFALSRVDLDQPVLLIGDLYDQNNLLAVRWQAASLTNQSTWSLDIDYFPFEQYEHSLSRTNRKPQIASIDPTFPRIHLNEVLERRHFAAIIEIKDLKNYFGPRANNPEDPLCGYPAQEMQLEGWIVIVYDVQTGSPVKCA